VNYLAHGHRFTDRPYFLAGTALPDWLSVVDRKIRLRQRHLAPHATGDGSLAAELAAGVLQHLHDDAWFHSTPAFYLVSGAIGKRLRGLLTDPDDHRPGFLGHILTEILLDSHLEARHPTAVGGYYAAIDRVDALEVARFVAQFTDQPVEGLARFIPLFQRERILPDYADSSRLCHRLNQVLRRVKLPSLEPTVIPVLDWARELVGGQVDALLQPPTDSPDDRTEQS
jgi:hypothetical protein